MMMAQVAYDLQVSAVTSGSDLNLAGKGLG